jgi:hypothetical protein
MPPAPLEVLGGCADRCEVIGNTVELFLSHGIQEPEKEKEGHHGRHKVGISHFPGAAMVPVLTFFHTLNYDDIAAA